ncbi:multiple sugar-binding protein precursor [Oxobacter pfennigii]|uniref:Multiple sugar-binding protein n=1 Tax=Oxobacter pfennigii TaxID=36849 RepID=A0A0N8NTX6_9CLOT|nr:extracellular solute-binding protein [Oxobacter pfennigii]KPU46056.1 multiple sugar-binding protein precursor [Oxobacter pfennigii]
MKKIKLISILVAALMTLTSCMNKIENSPIVGSKPVTLSFYTFYEKDEQAVAYKEIIEEFERSHENIKVILNAGGSNYDTKVLNALNSETPPDIIGLQRGKVMELSSAGNLKDITDWVNSNNISDNYYGVNLGYGKVDDKYYGLGDLPYVTQWYYNMDMFDKAKIEEPKTLDELIDVCNKLKKNIQTPIAIGAKDPWALNTFFGMIAAQTAGNGQLTKAVIANSREDFTNIKGYVDAIDIVSQLVKSGAINKRVADYTYNDSIEAFVQGKAAILPMGSWAVEKIEKTKPDNFSYKAFDIAPIFVESPVSQYSATAIQVITVNSKTKHEKEAMEFMDFLISDKAQEIFRDYNVISGLKSVNTNPKSQLDKITIEQLNKTNEDSVMYVDDISKKMMESTAANLLRIIKGQSVKADTLWKQVINESVAE